MRASVSPGRGWALLWPLLLILLGALALRLAILFTTASHVDGDEAVVGVMARHIVVHGARPIFYWGQAYGGGGAIEAWLAVIPLAVFGVSSVSLKLVALVFSLAAIPVTYWFCLRHYDRTTAVFATAILASATPLIELGLKVRGGYAALPLLTVGLFALYAHCVSGERRRRSAAFALGVTAGFAYYNQELIAPLLLVLLGAAVTVHRRQWSPGAGALVLLGMGVGAAPLIYFNIVTGFSNLHHMLALEREGGGPLWVELLRLPTYSLPRFFLARNADSYANDAPLRAWIEFAASAALTVSAAVAALARRRFRTAGLPFVGTLFAFTIVHLLAVVVSGRGHLSPRYFLPLYPAVAILAGVALRQWLDSPHRFMRRGAIATFAAVACLGVSNHAVHVGPSQVVDQVALAPDRKENRWTPGDAVTEILAHLEARGVRHVYAAHFVQWRLMFESEEAVIASSRGFQPQSRILPAYDRAVAAAWPVAWVFHRDSGQLRAFEAEIGKFAAEIERREIGPYRVYLAGAD